MAKTEKVVEITLRLDAHFVRMLNGKVGLDGGLVPDRQLDPGSVLSRLVLAEARGATEVQVSLIVPPEWRANIEAVHSKRRVYEGGWSQVSKE